MLSPHFLLKAGTRLICFAAFLPLLIIPDTLWEYVFIRNILFYYLVLGLLFAAIIYIQKNKYSLNFKADALFLFIGVFLLIRIISGIFGADPGRSFFGSQPRMDGNLGYIALFGWLAALLVFFDGNEYWKKLSRVNIFVATIVSTFSIIQPFFPQEWPLVGGVAVNFFHHRLTGTLGNPIFLAGYLLPNVFLGLYLATIGKKRKILWAASSVLFIAVILLTQTRGAILALAGTALVFAPMALIHIFKNNKKIFRVAFFSFIIPASVLMAIVASNQSLFARIISSFNLTSGATRLILWKIGLDGFFDKWFLGWGPENFSYVFSKFYNPQLLKFSFYETWADKPHNQLIEIAATSGTFGLIAFLGIFCAAFFLLWKIIKQDKSKFFPCLFLGAALFSFLIHIFFAFDTIELRLIIFCILAHIIFLSRQTFEGARQTNIRPARLIIIVTAIIMTAALSSVGTGTLKASNYTSRAANLLVDNHYADGAAYIIKLDGINTPYGAGNWEYLADIVLKLDAVGKLPRTITKDMLPILIKNLEVLSKKYPKNFSYSYRLAQMYNLAGLYIDSKYFIGAENALARAKAISPERQVSDLLLAQVYYHKREPEKALKILEELIKKHENIAEPYWYLGILYDASGQYDKAYAYMSAAVYKGHFPKNINEEILYVTAMGRYKDYKAMAPVYESIIRKDRDNPKWWAHLATTYFELKDYAKASQAARQAIFLSPAFGDEGGKFLKKIDEAQQRETK